MWPIRGGGGPLGNQGLYQIIRRQPVEAILQREQRASSAPEMHVLHPLATPCMPCISRSTLARRTNGMYSAYLAWRLPALQFCLQFCRAACPLASQLDSLHVCIWHSNVSASRVIRHVENAQFLVLKHYGHRKTRDSMRASFSPLAYAQQCRQHL